MNKEYLQEILELGWEDDEKQVISRILGQLKYWKKWLPKHLEGDINFILSLAISEKKKLNELLEKNKNNEETQGEQDNL